MNENREPDVTEKKKPEPLPFDPDGEILDWDAYFPPPPPKNRRTIRVQFRHKGPAQPMPYPDPDEE
ncbi:MAG TPA: hypothetical protein VFG68_12005 [Fimbriiglobus sp.]|nr:hypothetical protein [Fimbriiglobus sp.]